jgi:hypothetical protein
MVELAFSPSSDLFGALIATHDYLDDFRRQYPEIETASGRSVAWDSDDQGLPLPYTRDFGSRTHRRMSRKEEEGELAERRIRRRTVEDRAVGFYYRCVDRSCFVAQLWPDRLEELPRYDDSIDGFVCPSCGEPLIQGERRAPAVAVLVMLDGAERARLLLEEGPGLDIGRADAKGCIGLERLVQDDRVAAVSRRHVHLDLVGTHVTVTDLNSKNGTHLHRRLAAHEEQSRRLSPSAPTGWALRDIVVLPSGLVLERSGRRHPREGVRRPEDGLTTPAAAPTVAVRGEQK